MINFILVFIAVFLVSILLVANRTVRQTRRTLSNRSAAAQLRRGAGHMYKIARAVKTYTQHDAIAQLLLQETTRTLKLAVTLDPDHVSTRTALRECNEMLISFNEAKRDLNAGEILAYPESELSLLEAQMHLTGAARLLGGMGKRGLISQDQHQAIRTTLRHAQHVLELRLNLQQVARLQQMEPKTGADSQDLNDYLQPTLTS